MRRISIVLIILLVFLPMSAFATRGVGIKYGIEYAKFYPGQENCLTYKVYNPWDEDVVIELAATGELSQFYKNSGSVPVPAHTSSKEAIPVQICFDIPKMSKKKCPGTQYVGEVVAKEAKDDSVAGTGSATSVVAAASLTTNMVCSESISGGSTFIGDLGDLSFRDMFYVFVTLGSLAAFMALYTVYKRNPESKRRKYMKVYHKAMQLQKELTSDPFNQQKRERFEALNNQMQDMRADFN